MAARLRATAVALAWVPLWRRERWRVWAATWWRTPCLTDLTEVSMGALMVVTLGEILEVFPSWFRRAFFSSHLKSIVNKGSHDEIIQVSHCMTCHAQRLLSVSLYPCTTTIKICAWMHTEWCIHVCVILHFTCINTVDTVCMHCVVA